MLRPAPPSMPTTTQKSEGKRNRHLPRRTRQNGNPRHQQSQQQQHSRTYTRQELDDPNFRVEVVRLPVPPRSPQPPKLTYSTPPGFFESPQLLGYPIRSSNSRRAYAERPGPSNLLLDRRHENLGLLTIPATPYGHGGSKDSFNFVGLPFDIRAIIYNFLIPGATFHIQFACGTEKSKALTFRSGKRTGALGLTRDAIRRRHKFHKYGCPDRKELLDEDVYRRVSPVSLLWISREVYVETSRLFYAKSTFHFNHLRPLKTFLDCVSTANKGNIRSMQISHQPYGHPVLTQNAWTKILADHSWTVLCYRIRQECHGLQSMALELQMRRCPISFGTLHSEMIDPTDFSVQWLIPLLAFKEMKNLKEMKLIVQSFIKPEPVLEVESYHLRKEILGTKWNETKEAGKNGYGVKKRSPRVKTKILNIV